MESVRERRSTMKVFLRTNQDPQCTAVFVITLRSYIQTSAILLPAWSLHDSLPSWKATQRLLKSSGRSGAMRNGQELTTNHHLLFLLLCSALLCSTFRINRSLSLLVIPLNARPSCISSQHFIALPCTTGEGLVSAFWFILSGETSRQTLWRRFQEVTIFWNILYNFEILKHMQFCAKKFP